MAYVRVKNFVLRPFGAQAEGHRCPEVRRLGVIHVQTGRSDTVDRSRRHKHSPSLPGVQALTECIGCMPSGVCVYYCCTHYKAVRVCGG